VRGEQALRRSQRELQALADNTPDILSRFDRRYAMCLSIPLSRKQRGGPRKTFWEKPTANLAFLKRYASYGKAPRARSLTLVSIR
jgi:hypothetical protein